MTVHRSSLTPADAEVLALRALAHIVASDALRPRFLALTGLGADVLRARAGSADVMTATLDFLAGQEADLVACADALGAAPADLAAARALLGR